MDITLGTLAFVPASRSPELMAPPVAAAVAHMTDAGAVGVTEIDPGLSDTAEFCAHYEVGLEKAANCVILEAKRAERTWYAACIIPGSARADVNGLARRTLDARKASFAPMERAVELTGMEYGAITPLGLPSGWPILVDKAVADAAYVIVGSGVRKSKLAVPGAVLAGLPGAIVLEGLGRAVS